MAHSCSTPPFIVPTPSERDALKLVASYLARASSATATLLLASDGTIDSAFAFVVRDQYDASAALCFGLLDALEEHP